jgi:hypothetical protein
VVVVFVVCKVGMHEELPSRLSNFQGGRRFSVDEKNHCSDTDLEVVQVEYDSGLDAGGQVNRLVGLWPCRA